MRQSDLPRLGIILILVLTGCAHRPPISTQDTRLAVESLAKQAGFQLNRLQTNLFLLTSYQKSEVSSPDLIIYIEGDGRTWITRHRLSSDPTPRQPLALQLALKDNSPSVAYLARPCQYTPLTLDKACVPAVWSDLRFSETVIQSMNEAIQQLKINAKAKRLHLIGFSGGAAITLLVAARRNDVVSLRTVAGDLDPVTLGQYHQTTPLQGSLDPQGVLPQLRHIPQYHFSGEKDTIVPPFIAKDFVRWMIQHGSHCAQTFVLKNATHHEGWIKAWPTLLNLPLSCDKTLPKDS